MARVKTRDGHESNNWWLEELLGIRYFWGNEDNGSFFDPKPDDGGYVAITYFFSDEGSGGGWSGNEKANFESALESWSDVSKIRFVEVFKEEEADWVESKEAWDYDRDDLHGLSRHDSPVELGIGATQAKGQFNVNHEDWAAGGTGPGGAIYHSFVREIGHALGLEYSDDAFGAAQSEFGELSSAMGVWAGTPLSSVHGSVSGPLAYDIKAIQSLYGVNEYHNSGATLYRLEDAEKPNWSTGVAAHWESIWDTGGSDTIAYYGERNAVIDLNAAKLDGSKTGGGPASYVQNIMAGYTIAQGVEIEHARGGNGDDILRGNHLDNSLYGGKGDDDLYGESGNNRLFGGDGVDRFFGGVGNDTFYVDGRDFSAQYADGSSALVGGGGFDTIVIDDDDGTHIKLAGGDSVLTGAESVTEVFGGGGDDEIDASSLAGHSPYGFGTGLFLSGGRGDDILRGTSFVDELYGGPGDDIYYTKSGGDIIYGDGGRDTVVVGFNVQDASFHGGSNVDTLDFSKIHEVDAVDYQAEVNLELDAGFGQIHDARSTNTFEQDGFENVIGGIGADRLTGDTQSNILTGNLGEDIIRGGQGNDLLTGGATPGEGDGQRDDFGFNFGDGVDRITDFEHGIDKVVFSQSEVSGFDALKLTLEDGYTSVEYGNGGDAIWLEKVGDSIDASDFLFI